MHELNKTQEKLLSTPTAGVASEHSAYYRRLLSAGYKGHNQGLIGGASLYGTLGLVIGTLVAVPLMLAASVSGAWLLIPLLGALGATHGAETFSHIGTQAAISAEAAEINETRRILLDHLGETKNPEEKKAIQEQLDNQMQAKPLKKFFHWKTLLIGAAIGGALALGMALLATSSIGAAFLPEAVNTVATSMHFLIPIGTGTEATMAFTGTGMAVITAIGALAGAIIGIDREYVRRWLDGAEIAVNDQHNVTHELAVREREVTSLSIASTKESSIAAVDREPETAHDRAPTAKPAETQPTSTITDIASHARVAEQERAKSA